MAVQLDGEQLHLDTILPEYLEESDLPASTIAAIDTIISGSDVNDNFTVSKKDRYQSIGTQTNPMPAPVLQCDSGLMAERRGSRRHAGLNQHGAFDNNGVRRHGSFAHTSSSRHGSFAHTPSSRNGRKKSMLRPPGAGFPFAEGHASRERMPSVTQIMTLGEDGQGAMDDLQGHKHSRHFTLDFPGKNTRPSSFDARTLLYGDANGGPGADRNASSKNANGGTKLEDVPYEDGRYGGQLAPGDDTPSEQNGSGSDDESDLKDDKLNGGRNSGSDRSSVNENGEDDDSGNSDDGDSGLGMGGSQSPLHRISQKKNQGDPSPSFASILAQYPNADDDDEDDEDTTAEDEGGRGGRGRLGSLAEESSNLTGEDEGGRGRLDSGTSSIEDGSSLTAEDDDGRGRSDTGTFSIGGESSPVGGEEEHVAGETDMLLSTTPDSEDTILIPGDNEGDLFTSATELAGAGTGNKKKTSKKNMKKRVTRHASFRGGMKRGGNPIVRQYMNPTGGGGRPGSTDVEAAPMAIWKNIRKLPKAELENTVILALPVLSVLKTISQVYLEIIQLRKVQFDLSSPNLQQFTIDFFSHKYGLQALALKHLFVFLVNIRRQTGKHHRIDTFSRLTGMLNFVHDSHPSHYDAGMEAEIALRTQISDNSECHFLTMAQDFFLRTCDVLHNCIDRGAKQNNARDRLFPDDLVAHAPTKQVIDKLDTIFSPGTCNLGLGRPSSLGLPHEELQALAENINKLEHRSTTVGGRKVVNKKRSTMIDVDHALTDILAQFYVAREHHFEYLEALYLAGDVNGNGVAIGEFELLLKLLDPSISKYSVLGSYRECQELTAKDNKPLADARANGKRKSEGGKQPITPEAFAYTVFTHPNFRVEPILHSVPSMKTVAGSLLKREHAAGLDAQPPTHTNADIEAVIQSPAFNYHDWLVVELGEIWENKRPNILLGLNAISGAQQRQTVFNLISRIDCLLMGDLLVEAKAAWIAFDILMQETTALQSASMVQMYPLKQGVIHSCVLKSCCNDHYACATLPCCMANHLSRRNRDVVPPCPFVFFAGPSLLPPLSSSSFSTFLLIRVQLNRLRIFPWW
jgi:hypothetical protein